jgi:hypothetical protein
MENIKVIKRSMLRDVYQNLTNELKEHIDKQILNRIKKNKRK